MDFYDHAEHEFKGSDSPTICGSSERGSSHPKQCRQRKSMQVLLFARLTACQTNTSVEFKSPRKDSAFSSAKMSNIDTRRRISRHECDLDKAKLRNLFINPSINP